MSGVQEPLIEPIAVVGLDCRVPGARHPDEFWELLVNGVDAVTEVPPGRWDIDAYYDENAGVPGKMNTRFGGFLDDIEMFDPEFFGLSHRAATFMDPQQRLLLEVVWAAFEDAGMPADAVAGSNCAAFIGISQNEYGRLVSAEPDEINAYTLVGNAPSVSVNRLSYFFDLHGPSMAIDSACSSSLVAVHLACQSLRSGESDLAIAGGCNLILSPHATIAASQLWLTSPGGRCRSFSTDGDGFVRSEAVGAVVLKRLADVQRDGDRCYAVLRGSAINQNGRGSGITAPNSEAQAAVIHRALRSAGITADTVAYIEGHGTGSRANDARELDVFQQVFGGRPRYNPCRLGSVKANIGSAEAAGGVIGLIKVVLALQHSIIPPHLHYDTPNPQIEGDSGLRLPTEPHTWPRSTVPRLAGVHSYGIGGTNAHVVVGEAPSGRPSAAGTDDKRYPILLAARTPSALRSLAQRLRDHVIRHPEQAIAAIASTLAYGRVHFSQRLAVFASSTSELTDALTAWLDRGAAPSFIAGSQIRSLPSTDDHEDPTMAAASRWVMGEQIAWSSFGVSRNVERISLPTYPYQRVRCWYRS